MRIVEVLSFDPFPLIRSSALTALTLAPLAASASLRRAKIGLTVALSSETAEGESAAEPRMEDGVMRGVTGGVSHAVRPASTARLAARSRVDVFMCSFRVGAGAGHPLGETAAGASGLERSASVRERTRYGPQLVNARVDDKPLRLRGRPAATS